MSISWNFFVSKRVYKGSVETWVRKSNIKSEAELLVFLSRNRVRPPSPEQLSKINWDLAVDSTAKSSKDSTSEDTNALSAPLPTASVESEISLGQEALNQALENKEASSKKERSPRKKTATSKKPAAKQASTRKKRLSKSKTP